MIGAGKLIVMVGAPGSGKSTYIKENKGIDDIVVSRDRIRFEKVKEGEEYFSKEKEVFNQFVDEIATALKDMRVVYADATHLTPGSRNKLYYAIKNKGVCPNALEARVIDPGKKICVMQNENRLGGRSYVPERQVMEMWDKLKYPTGMEDVPWDRIYINDKKVYDWEEEKNGW